MKKLYLKLAHGEGHFYLEGNELVGGFGHVAHVSDELKSLLIQELFDRDLHLDQWRRETPDWAYKDDPTNEELQQ